MLRWIKSLGTKECFTELLHETNDDVQKEESSPIKSQDHNLQPREKRKCRTQDWKDKGRVWLEGILQVSFLCKVEVGRQRGVSAAVSQEADCEEVRVKTQSRPGRLYQPGSRLVQGSLHARQVIVGIVKHRRVWKGFPGNSYSQSRCTAKLNVWPLRNSLPSHLWPWGWVLQLKGLESSLLSDWESK